MIRHTELPAERLPLVFRLLFQSHPYYLDRGSRAAVRKCLQSLHESLALSEVFVKALIAAIKAESNKPGIAASNAFVLLEWSGNILAQISKSPEAFNKYIQDVLTTQVALLDICMGSLTAKGSLKKSALAAARRGLRAAFSLKSDYKLNIKTIVDKLTTKAPSSTSKNALLLGIVSGVCARASKPKEVLEELKKDIYAFFVREIVGSRTPVPNHISESLHDFFASFTTALDFDTELVPALERALLRAPEVVLDVIPALFTAIPDNIDLSKPVAEKLLKQFLSCVKSSNANIRNGAVTAFKASISRTPPTDPAAILKIAEELVTPLKTGKVASADQRVLYGLMLKSLPRSPQLAKIVSAGLVETVVKEPNEAAVGSLSAALFWHFPIEVGPEKTVIDAISKGLVDKRPNFRRIWVARLGDLVWSLPDTPPAATQAFIGTLIPKLVDSWADVVANPLPATQSGLVTAGYVFTAIALEKLSKWADPQVKAALKTTDIITAALAMAPRASFLLNPKVFTKLTDDDDNKWAARALMATADAIIYDEIHADAWVLSVLYMICAATVSMAVKKEALASLTAAYLRRPDQIGRIILAGVWQWLRTLEHGAADRVPAAAKTGGTQLHTVVHAFVLPPTEDVNKEIVKNQLVNLAVVAHHELMPGVDWIRLCQRAAIDPGELAREKATRLVAEIRMYTGLSGKSNHIRAAALKSAATLAFVAPETITPLIVEMITNDLNPALLRGIGPVEASIWRAPAGIAFINVLNSRSTTVEKGKDTDTLKWEAELRAQLAAKKGGERKLTSEEKARVEEQIVKETEIRGRVTGVELKLTRGIGLIKALAEGPPTSVEMWMGKSVRALLKAMEAGAGLVVGDSGVKAFLACSEHVSARLGVLRMFVGIDTLRALGIKELAPELQEEPLGGKFYLTLFLDGLSLTLTTFFLALTTRILYRLRFMAEQRPFDTTSLVYLLPFVGLILEMGGVGVDSSEDTDEQVVLAIEFLSFHTETCGIPTRLPSSENTY